MQTLQQIVSTLTAVIVALSAQVGNLSQSVIPASQLAQVAPTSGLVEYWNFDSESSAGRVGNAKSFNGTSDYFQTSADLKSYDSFTASAWIKADSTTMRHILWQGNSLGNGGGDEDEFAINVGNTTNGQSGQLQLFIEGTNNDINISTSFNDTSNWNHVTAVVSGLNTSAPSASLYLNGSLAGTDSADTISRAGWDTNLRIGRPGISDRLFDGLIDEVRIYNRTLTASEITDIYNDTGSGGTPPPPPTPINGSCGTTVNSCTSGAFSDVTDNSTDYLWSCQGSNGGTTASCSLPVSTPPPPPPSGNTFYVRQGASGNGSDWNNAYGSIPSSLQRGATYYIADGSYGSYTFDDPNSGTQVITIKKATASDHGTNTGWSSAYGDGQAVFGSFILGSDYLTIDGSTRNESNWSDGPSYGFRLSSIEANTSFTSGICASNIIIKYVNGGGAESVSYTGSEDNHVFKVAGFDESCTNWTIQRTYAHNIAHAAIYHMNGLIGGLFEYNLLSNSFGKEAIRGQINFANVVIRYNVFKNACGSTGIAGEGCTAEIAAWDGNNFSGNQIYGNTFLRTTSDGNSGGTIVVGGNGGSWVGPSANNTLVYNNTIAGLQGFFSFSGNIIINGGTGNICRNNLWYDVIGTPSCNANTVSNNVEVTYNPFVNYAGGDLRLSSATQNGTTLSSPYNLDMDGVTRGQGGTWDLGAYEYVGGTPTPTPSPSGNTFYIRDGGTSSSCTDWTNACDTLPSTLVRGATYYVADGSYAGYNFDDANSGSTQIIVKKATASDHGTNTGWSSAYGDGQAVWGSLTFTRGYYTFDGVTGGGPGNWESGFGFKINGSIGAPQYVDNNSDYITIAHTDLSTGDVGPSDNRGMVLYGHDNFTISYSYLHDIGCDLISANVMNNFTIEYSKLARNHQAEPGCHGDLIEYQIGDASNFTIRHNFFEDIVGSYAFGSHGPVINGYNIYGNIFYWPNSSFFGNGVVGALSSAGTISNLKFYNNTLYGDCDGLCGFGQLRGSGNQAYNNIWYMTGSGSVGFNNATAVNNTCYGTTCTGQQNLSGNPFVSPSTRDFRLSSASSAGTPLSSPYNTDMLGATRGTDGNWDRGAIEFTGGSTPPPPPPPTSTAFAPNDPVQVNVGAGSNLNVRSTPTTSATPIGTQPHGALGTIISGGTQADSYFWWNVNFDSGVDGYVVEDFLVDYVAPPPPPTGNTFYIRDGGTSSSCTDWANACDTLPSTLQRGATYYIADGSYAGYTFDDPNSGTQVITIKKATASDHGTNTGWNSTYGDGQAEFTGGLNFATDYWVIDGSKRNESKWDDGPSYGIKARSVGTNYFWYNHAADNVTIKYMDIGADYGFQDSDSYGEGIYLGGFAEAAENWLVQRSYIHNVSVLGQHAGVHNVTYEYNFLGPSWSKSGIRHQGRGSSVTIRYNIFRNACQGHVSDPTSGYSCTAIIGWYGNAGSNMEDYTNSQVYGNLFIDTVGGVFYSGGVIIMADDRTSQGGGPGNCTGCKIFNNTFVGMGKNNTSSNVGFEFTGVKTNTEARNNIFYDIGTRTPFCQAASCSNNVKITNGSIFVSPSSDNYKLVSNGGAGTGTTLSAPYNIDMTGTTRGADGVWDIGAYEATGTATPPPPTPIVGDFNGDGLVNSIDLSLLTGAWNTSNSTYDLNRDSIVNSLDYVIMVQNWST